MGVNPTSVSIASETNKIATIMRLKTLILAFFIIAGLGASAQDDKPEKETRLIQVSIIPNLGTKNHPADIYVNNISWNIFAGYQGGVKGVEFGSFVNIDNGDVLGAQGAGFVNIVTGDVTGAQGAGFVNYVHGSSKGLQSAGFVNFNKDSFTGAQGAGFVNYVGSMKGAQGAGFVNVSLKDATGAQGAGFVNATLGKHKGVQAAGFANVAEEIQGLQAAGFVNVAKKVNGVQLGFINVADTVEKGVNIGIINIVRKGMHNFEVDHNDITDANLSFKGGTHRLYSIISTGFKAGDDAYWSTGAGLGMQKDFAGKLYANVEFTSNSIHPKDEPFENLNLVNKLNPNIGYQLTPFMSINGGPVLNLYYTSAENGQGALVGPRPRKPFYDETVNNKNLRMWVGYRVAIRF